MWTGSRGTVAKSQESFGRPPAVTTWTRIAGVPGQQVPVKGQVPLPKLQGMPGPCFSCGEMGHLERFCPKLMSGPSRWYPSDDETK